MVGALIRWVAGMAATSHSMRFLPSTLRFAEPIASRDKAIYTSGLERRPDASSVPEARHRETLSCRYRTPNFPMCNAE